MPCIKINFPHVGFILECKNGNVRKFWCVREMKSIKIALSKKERKLQVFKVGEWYHANLENDCFVKADEEFPTRIRQNFLEIQAPLILFTESSNEQEQGFDDIQQAKRRNNKQEYSIGYVPGLGRVGVFLKKSMKKQEFHRVWVKKVDFSSIPKTVKDEKHEIHWIVDDQEPKKMELIDLLTFRHINIATGIVVHKDDEKIQIWNEKFRLLDKFIDGENLNQVGAWVKFSHIEDFTGHSIATNLMEIKKPMGFEKMIDGHNFCLQIALYHIQIQPETQHYYIKNLGTLDDPKNFLPNLNKNFGDYKQVVIVSFDKKAKIWKVEDFIGPKIQSKPIHMVATGQKYQVLMPQSLCIPSSMGVMTKQKVFVKVPKKIKTKIWLKTTAIQSEDFIEADENEMKEDDVVSLESNQSRETTLSIIDHSSPIPSFSNSNHRSMLELEILLYKIYLNHMNGFKVPIDQHDFFIWLKSALKVSIADDDLCLNAWKRWSLFLTLEEEGEDFEQFMIRIRNNFEAELGKNDIEETNSINSTNLSTSTEFIGDDYDALGILLRKLYLFEQEGYKVPDCEEKFVNWLLTSCNGTLSEEFCDRAWKMWRLLRLAILNEVFKRKLDVEIFE